MKSRPTQFELALLAMTLDGTHEPVDRVKLAMAVWDGAGEALFPASTPRVTISLDEMLERLFPVVDDGKKKLSVKAIKTARMAKYRKFLQWCEWAIWGPDFMRAIPNARYGGDDEIPVTKAFVGEKVKATIKVQGKDGILDAEKVEEDFRYFCLTEELRRETVYSERGRKGAAATHAKKGAAKSPGSAATVTKRRVPRKKTVQKRQPKTH